MMGSELGLKWFIKLVGVLVCFELGNDGMFQYFRQNREIGDGVVDVRIKASLFNDR